MAEGHIWYAGALATPPWSRRQTRPWSRPEGGGVMVSVHSTALPPWSSVPHGDGVRACPTVPRPPPHAVV